MWPKPVPRHVAAVDASTSMAVQTPIRSSLHMLPASTLTPSPYYHNHTTPQWNLVPSPAVSVQPTGPLPSPYYCNYTTITPYPQQLDLAPSPSSAACAPERPSSPYYHNHVMVSPTNSTGNDSSIGSSKYYHSHVYKGQSRANSKKYS